jgi:hypothetical protein
MTVPAVPRKTNPVDKLLQMTQQYVAIAGQGLRDEANKQKAAELLLEISKYVIVSHDHSVYDAFLGFMLRNRAIMLSTRTVMNGVLDYVPNKDRVVQIVQLYVIFEALAESRMERTAYTINTNHVRDLFHNKDLADWLSEQKKK